MLPWLPPSAEGSPSTHSPTQNSPRFFKGRSLTVSQPPGETLARETSVKCTLSRNISIFFSTQMSSEWPTMAHYDGLSG